MVSGDKYAQAASPPRQARVSGTVVGIVPLALALRCGLAADPLVFRTL
jgi:hypothetical protein